MFEGYAKTFQTQVTLLSGIDLSVACTCVRLFPYRFQQNMISCLHAKAVLTQVLTQLCHLFVFLLKLYHNNTILFFKLLLQIQYVDVGHGIPTNSIPTNAISTNRIPT